jgi:glycosyltransferase involved in cell wall biosynthesis
MKVAIVHDSFTQMGGAERVVDHLHELFPDAPVFTLVFDPKFAEKYKGWDIRTSQLQTLYIALGKLQYLLPWVMWAVDNMDFSGFDVVISSSSGFVKNIRIPKNTKHICYCHTPPRFLWLDKNYVKEEVPFLLRPFVNYILSKMRKWDLAGSKRVTHFIANSKEVQSRIKEVYALDSEVVYPGIDVDFWSSSIRRHSEAATSNSSSAEESLPWKRSFAPADRSQDGAQDDASAGYFLIAGRLQPHKNNEMVVEVFNQLGIPLHVVGTGRQEGYLKSIAKSNVKFLGAVDDIQLRDEYIGALGYIYPQVEDFGLMPLEAAACGTATIAFGKGGALETVVPGVTGEIFGSAVSNVGNGLDRSLQGQLKQIIQNWRPQKYSADALKTQAQKFSKEKFKDNILTFLKKLYPLI